MKNPLSLELRTVAVESDGELVATGALDALFDVAAVALPAVPVAAAGDVVVTLLGVGKEPTVAVTESASGEAAVLTAVMPVAAVALAVAVERGCQSR